MSASHQLALVPSVAVIAFVVTAPDAIEAQTMSARPAAISLTVVVPPRSNDLSGIAIDRHATLISRSASMIDLEKMVGLVDRPTSRVEVRRGAGWSVDAPRVWVRNQRGEFEPLDADASVVAVDAPASLARAQSTVRFRVDANHAEPTRISVPVEYRITVGEGDQIAVWRFTSMIRADSLSR
jgi:hypothetical protein